MEGSRLACAAAVLAAAVLSSAAAGAGGDARPFSVQLHVHGSASEGIASIDSHSDEAREVGADVIWWSDHDFRIASYHHPTAFDFEAWAEPIDAGESWREPTGLPRGRGALRRRAAHDAESGDASQKMLRKARRSTAAGAAEITADRADDGSHSLRVRAAGEGPEFQELLYQLMSARSLFKRPLFSDVAIELSVYPEALGPDARALVEVMLSEHPPKGDLPRANYLLRYVLDNARTAPERRGTTLEVPVAYREGGWNRLVLPVTRDVVAGFPMIRGEDNSMAVVALGVEARRGATASALFDRFRIAQRIAGDQAYDRQAQVIEQAAADHPGLVQLQGVEISYASQHLNEFSIGTRLLDYESVLAEAAQRHARAAAPAVAGAADADAGDADSGDESAAVPADVQDAVARRAVAEAHARGGLVSYNHMFGAAMAGGPALASRDAILAKILANRAYGADILEVGYRDRGGHDLADHLWVWDQLALAGLHFVGVGVSDSHGGPRQRWRTSPNNFLSWIWARSPTKPELLAGMRAGRIFFGDITLFHGSVDLTTARGWRMGQIVLSDRESEDVAIAIRGVAAGDAVRVVQPGAPPATLNATSADVDDKREIALPPGGTTLVRIAVESADGKAKVSSNPITWVRRAPEAGIPAARAGIDVGGVRSERIEGFTVTGAEASGGKRDAPDAVVLRGRGDGGIVELDASSLGRDVAVTFTGLAGTWSFEPPRLTLRDLRGEGTVEIRRAGTRPAVEPASGAR